MGATAAYAMMLRALFEEIVIIDSKVELARAEAADLVDANALARPARIWARTYADAASAQIAVVTAGAASHGNESRLSLGSRSAVIVTECVRGLCEAGFDGVLVIASNPVDLMTMVAIRHAGLSPCKVIGTEHAAWIPAASNRHLQRRSRSRRVPSMAMFLANMVTAKLRLSRRYGSGDNRSVRLLATMPLLTWEIWQPGSATRPTASWRVRDILPSASQRPLSASVKPSCATNAPCCRSAPG